MKFYTYVHYLPSGEPFYVGKGSNGRSSPKFKRNSDYRLLLLIHGIDNIKCEIIYCSSEDEAFYLENQLIKKFSEQGHKLVNRTSGGEGRAGWKHTEETRKKISEAGMGKKLSEVHKATLLKILIGHPGWHAKTPEALANQRNSRRGVKNTPEHNAKISAAKMGHFVSEEQKQKQREKMRGRKQSLEAKAKQIAAQTGKKPSEEWKRNAREGLLKYFEKRRKENNPIRLSEQHREKIASGLRKSYKEGRRHPSKGPRK